MSGMIGALFGAALEGAGKGMVAAADNQIAQDNARIAADQKLAMEQRLYAAKQLMDEQAAMRAQARVAEITGKKVTEKVAGAATEFDDDGNPTAPNASTNTRSQTSKEKVQALSEAGMLDAADKQQKIANGEATEQYHKDLVDARKEGIAQKDRAATMNADVRREAVANAKLRYFDENGNLRPSPGIAIADINSYTRRISDNNKAMVAIEKDIAAGRYYDSPDKDPDKQYLKKAHEKLATLEADTEAAREAQRKAIDAARTPAPRKGAGMVTAAPVDTAPLASLPPAPSAAKLNPSKASQDAARNKVLADNLKKKMEASKARNSVGTDG